MARSVLFIDDAEDAGTFTRCRANQPSKFWEVVSLNSQVAYLMLLSSACSGTSNSEILFPRGHPELSCINETKKLLQSHKGSLIYQKVHLTKIQWKTCIRIPQNEAILYNLHFFTWMIFLVISLASICLSSSNASLLYPSILPHPAALPSFQNFIFLGIFSKLFLCLHVSKDTLVLSHEDFDEFWQKAIDLIEINELGIASGLELYCCPWNYICVPWWITLD